jgi:hypothetical protein
MLRTRSPTEHALVRLRDRPRHSGAERATCVGERLTLKCLCVGGDFRESVDQHGGAKMTGELLRLTAAAEGDFDHYAAASVVTVERQRRYAAGVEPYPHLRHRYPKVIEGKTGLRNVHRALHCHYGGSADWLSVAAPQRHCGQSAPISDEGSILKVA